jgi:hypothetical protein
MQRRWDRGLRRRNHHRLVRLTGEGEACHKLKRTSQQTRWEVSRTPILTLGGRRRVVADVGGSAMERAQRRGSGAHLRGRWASMDLGAAPHSGGRSGGGPDGAVHDGRLWWRTEVRCWATGSTSKEGKLVSEVRHRAEKLAEERGSNGSHRQWRWYCSHPPGKSWNAVSSLWLRWQGWVWKQRGSSTLPLRVLVGSRLQRSGGVTMRWARR